VVECVGVIVFILYYCVQKFKDADIYIYIYIYIYKILGGNRLEIFRFMQVREKCKINLMWF
jgi:hypothetical protein